MSHVPVTFNGVIYPKNKRDKPFAATFVGYAWISGLKPDHSPPGDQPVPEHPIVLPPEIGVPPDAPGIWPPGTWGGSGEPMPTPPIEMPPPTEPPTPPNIAKPPPEGGGWAWGPNVGWIYVPGDESPGPKSA